MALDSHLDSRLANLSLSEIASLLSPKQQEVLLASISVAASLIQQIQQEDSMTQQLQQQQQQQQQYQQEQPQQLTTHSPQQQLNQTHHQQQHQLTPHQLTTSHHHLLSHTQTKRESHLSSKSTTSATSCYDEDDDLSDEGDEESHDFQNHTTNSTTTTTCYGEGHDADEKDLLTIRQFAEELKSRRKAIRLSQKGAAQSLRAFTGGAQPCTDAIIYHFENLQLEPERAMQLIPLLTDWLEWAEKHRYNGKQLPMMSAVTKVPRERKRKVVLFNEKAKQHLEDEFSKNNHPDRYQLDVISHELDIPTRSIRKWFTNRRQRKRFAEKFLPALSPE